MGRVTVLLSGVPKYVTLNNLCYYLDCLFHTNPEIGKFEIRRILLEDTNTPQIALDFRSGFDAIAAQEQLDGYSYVMEDGQAYILRAKITNKKEYLRNCYSPERSRSMSKTPSMAGEASSALALIPTMSDGAVYRANAKLDAKYKLLKKQKLIVQTERELLRERRKLKEELRGFKDGPAKSKRKRSQRSPSTHQRPWSEELELLKCKLRKTSKVEDLGALDWYSKRSTSEEGSLSSTKTEHTVSKSRRTKSESLRSPERSFRNNISPGMRSGSPKSRTRNRRSKSKSRERASGDYRSRSRTRKSRKRLLQSPKSRTRDRTSKSKSRERASRDYRSRSRTPRSRTRSPTSKTGSRARGSREYRSNSRKCLLQSPKSRTRNRTSKSKSRERASRDNRSRSKSRSGVPRSWTRSSAKKLRDTSPEPLSPGSKNQSPKIQYQDPQDTNIHANHKKTSELEDKKRRKRGKKILNKTFGKDTLINNESESCDKKDIDKSTKAKTAKNKVARQEAAKNKDTIIQSVSNDIMFRLQTSILKLSIKYNTTLSYSSGKLLDAKLKVLVQDRVQSLSADEKFSKLTGVESYIKLYEKQDTGLLKEILDNLILTQNNYQAMNQKDNSTESACNAPENRTQEVCVDLTTDTTNTKDDNVKYNSENSERERRDACNGDARIITDAETLCPEVSSGIPITVPSSIEQDIDKPSDSHSDKPLPACPKFVLVIKKLMKQLKPVIYGSRKKGVCVNYYDMKQVLKILLKDIVKGKGYMTTKQIVKLFRDKYSRDNDAQFVRDVAVDISLNKYGDLDGVVNVESNNEDDDNDDVIFIENKTNVVTILDSDDEPEIKSMKNEPPIEQQLEGEMISVTIDNANKLTESDNRSQDETEEYMISNGQEFTVADTGVKQAETSLCENTIGGEDSLKVTAITIVTSETELHSIANAIEIYKDKDSFQETIENETVPKFTDSDIENLLRVDNETVPKFPDADIENLLRVANLNSNILHSHDTYEKEEPLVTSITIMTSESELLTLNQDSSENVTKELPVLKVENNIDIYDEHEIQTAQIQADENKENEASHDLGDTNDNLKHTNVELVGKKSSMLDDEEETIESIYKYLTSFSGE